MILDTDYYEKLINYFINDKKVIGIQGIDRSLIEAKNNVTNIVIFDKLIYCMEQFFETSVLLNKQNSFVSPSLAVAHPNVHKEFEVESQWISTCAGVFKNHFLKNILSQKILSLILMNT